MEYDDVSRLGNLRMTDLELYEDRVCRRKMVLVDGPVAKAGVEVMTSALMASWLTQHTSV